MRNCDLASTVAVLESATGESRLPRTTLLAPKDLADGSFVLMRSALYTLYESLLRETNDVCETHRIHQAMDEVSQRASAFAYAAYLEREESYPFEILSPYLPYSLCQAAIIQHRLWLQSGDENYKQRLGVLRAMMQEFAQRWHLACMTLRGAETTERVPLANVLRRALP
jgi:hypothetical protein